MSNETNSVMTVGSLTLDWAVFDDWNAARAKYATLDERDRKQFITVLSAFKSVNDIVLNFNIAKHYIFLCVHECPKIAEMAFDLRRINIRDNTYRKAFECIESIDIDELKEAEKSKVAKELLTVVKELSLVPIGETPKESTTDVMKRLEENAKDSQ